MDSGKSTGARIGLISDIHANLPALEAVLEDMPSVDKIVCAGDIIGYNPWPAECVERIRDVSAVCVRGNHDQAIINPAVYGHNEMARASLELAERALSAGQRRWLTELPIDTTILDNRYKIAHSHPDPSKLGEYVYRSNYPELRLYLDDFDGIILGHTHIQEKAIIDDRLIVNPGSVGQPRDGNPDAAYAILDTEAESVELRRVSYNVHRVMEKIEAMGLPEDLAVRLVDGS